MPFPPMYAHRSRVVLAGLFVAAVGSLDSGASAQSPGRILDAVALELTTVADSTQYPLYECRVKNSTASRAGVAWVSLDVSAPMGTGRVTLPFTGRHEHGASGRADHVPVGGIAPDGWKMELLYNGKFNWYAATVGTVVNDSWLPASGDSAAPGGSKEGFGLRSPYLPGIRGFIAEPTWQSCCSRPMPGASEGEHAAPAAFRVTGFAVGPTVPPQRMTLSVLGADLQQACGALRWITGGAVCGRLRSELEEATRALQRGDAQAAKGSLRVVLAELEAQHAPGKPVNDNAYWLLKVNGEYLLARM